eukprot:766684-Hanusia_phi.AAC.5
MEEVQKRDRRHSLIKYKILHHPILSSDLVTHLYRHSLALRRESEAIGDSSSRSLSQSILSLPAQSVDPLSPRSVSRSSLSHQDISIPRTRTGSAV